jgi:hypothetical protein
VLAALPWLPSGKYDIASLHELSEANSEATE